MKNMHHRLVKMSILTASALEIAHQLDAGSLSSVQVVEACLDQIERHNRAGLGLHAIISVAPRESVLAQAQTLDDERRRGSGRSRLHGVPIVVKDAIVTNASLGMPTTVGSHVFASMKAKRNAAVVDKLVDAGMIIIGKGNLTEFCGLKSNEAMGWSSYGGQTLSPYRRADLPDDDQPIPGGSSTGSAVSVAAGFCPIAIGTETAGSVVFPASCNGLYGLKLRPDSAPGDGIFKLSESFDGVGVIARTAMDCVALAGVLMGKEDLSSSFSESWSWSDLRIGVVPNDWGLYPSSKEKWSSQDILASYTSALETMRANGANVAYPLTLVDHRVLQHDGETLTTVAYHEFPAQVEKFITNFEPAANLKSLGDIVDWNESHADIALPEPYPSQSELTKALNNTMTEDTGSEVVTRLHQLADLSRNEAEMDVLNMDIILAPSDATLVSFAACAGWPIATVPLGRWKKNGQPYGYFAVARDGREDLLFQFMSMYYDTFKDIVERPRCLFSEKD